MESGKRVQTEALQQADSETDTETQTEGRKDRQTEPHTKRLEPCSSIWPGQIRLQHSGIYQVHYLNS